MKYELLDGSVVNLDELPREDLAFLVDLMRRALDEEDYFALEMRVCGAGAYPLKGSIRVTREIHDSLLFRVAEDVADRAGIRQGRIAPGPGDVRVPVEDVMTVNEAAQRLGVTRSAIVKAAQEGRIQGKRIGRIWVLLRRSVESYEVARHRVEAGRAAHRHR